MSKGVSEQEGVCRSDLLPKTREKKCRVYVGFMDLEKLYDTVNREALWQILRMYDVGGKLLNSIKSTHVNSLARVRVEEGESESQDR